MTTKSVYRAVQTLQSRPSLGACQLWPIGPSRVRVAYAGEQADRGVVLLMQGRQAVE
jgi:hypothetical protein